METLRRTSEQNNLLTKNAVSERRDEALNNAHVTSILPTTRQVTCRFLGL